MPSATFFLIPKASEDEQNALICDKIAELYRKHKRLRVWAQSQAQAEALDELLWQRPADAFIPHNLVGEGASTGAPVEIGWPQTEPGSSRPGYALFNLANEVPVQAQQSQQLYEQKTAQLFIFTKTQKCPGHEVMNGQGGEHTKTMET